MSYDPKTNTILIGETQQSLANGMGKAFLRMAKEMAELPDAPPDIKKDWEVLKSWLKCPDGEIDSETYKRFGLAWQSYLALGISPSTEMKGAFTSFKDAALRESWQTIPIPPEVKPVFDRMLALQRAEPAPANKENEAKDVQRVAFDKEKLTKVCAALWVLFSIPVSEHLYDEVLDHGYLMRIFALAIVAMPVWLLFGWRWITGNALFPKKVLNAICVVAVMCSAILFNDRQEVFYIPLLEALVLVLLISVKEHVALIEGPKKALVSYLRNHKTTT